VKVESCTQPVRSATFSDCKRLNDSCAGRCGRLSNYIDHLFCINTVCWY